MSKPPATRIQLRWELNNGNYGYSPSEYKWICHYELVIPLGEFDIRREFYGPRGGIKKRKVLVIPMKEPSARSSSSAYPPCTTGDGKTRFCDTPYRDGAHAMWDAKHLGNPPIYVIAPDGMTFKWKGE
jgi:hypothetical protein